MPRQAVHHFGTGNQDPGPGVRQDVLDLARLIEFVDQDGNTARTGHAKERRRRLGTPREEYADPVAGREAGLQQVRGIRIGPVRQRGKGRDLVACDDRRALAERPRACVRRQAMLSPARVSRGPMSGGGAMSPLCDSFNPISARVASAQLSERA